MASKDKPFIWVDEVQMKVATTNLAEALKALRADTDYYTRTAESR
jgi:hypothetical protein